MDAHAANHVRHDDKGSDGFSIKGDAGGDDAQGNHSNGTAMQFSTRIDASVITK
jgi:hypothetical protein